MSASLRQNRASLREKATPAPKKSAPARKAIPGEVELQKWIAQAEYEVHVDPYRGIQSLVASLQRDETMNGTASAVDVDAESAWNETAGPWRSHCAFDVAFQHDELENTNTCSPAIETVDSVDEGHESNSASKLYAFPPDTDDDDFMSTNATDARPESDAASTELVRLTCLSTCPSLIQWTSRATLEQQKKARHKKKRKLVESVTPLVCGRRRHYTTDNLLRRCSCDYNPFCLGTLGGAMDDALDEWSRQADVLRHTASELDDADSTILEISDSTSPVATVWDWSDPSFAWYGTETSALLKTVRKSQWVDKLAIRQYLQKSLQSLTVTLSPGDAVHRIEGIHQSLIFQNPLTHAEDDRKKLHLSLPPGIENLGATCYLNTQMQCLAQNRVFVQGIMSWQPPQGATQDRMNSVLGLYQQLLLRMNAGPKCSVDTLEFSTALGLDHHEQQDPNEFSRLLFERMHASFQGISSGGNSNGSNLAELLPHLFQGIMMYETSCLTCKSTSRRTEEFMDLNLPIVHPKKFGQLDIGEALFAKGNTDVQYCLQEYCVEETLDGDNQYFCSHCGCKRDAKRALTFQKLPPVLNVQISRYVFDREKFVKKKLSDKVLLPLDLEITARSIERKQGSVTHRYVLCAVMRHKGTSAYSGHYVAEAMDWLTGQWFEFNDEKVVLLESGPSCSFNPSLVKKDLKLSAKTDTKSSAKSDAKPSAKSDAKTSAKTDTKSSAKTDTKASAKNAKPVGAPELSGSQDAYNMYYVEESFLAQSALDCLRKTKDASDAMNVEAVADIEREESYADLSRLCIRDRTEAERLENRRTIIRQKIIPAMRGFTVSNRQDVVWVETAPFLQFMSCCERIPIRPSPSPFCSHKTPGLHPRIARRGKLLPKVVFDTYTATLLAEQQCKVTNQADFEVQESIPVERVVCPECAHDYQLELSEKLVRIKALKFLYDELNPKDLQFSPQLAEGEVPGKDDKFAYVVSRKFVTWFRNKFAQVLKKASVAMAEAKIGYTGSACGEHFAQNMAEGLDGFDFHEFGSTYVPEPGSAEDDEFSVNRHITCSHGQVNALSSKSVVYVPERIWSVIKEHFPNAIEHKRRRRGALLDSDSDDENFDLGCRECRSEGAAEDGARKSINSLVKHCNECLACPILTLESAFDQARDNVKAEFRLLHYGDLGAWHKFVAGVRKKNDKRSLEAIARASLFPASLEGVSDHALLKQNGVVVSNANRKRLEFLAKVFRPIMCKRHNLPIREALFQTRNGVAPSNLNKNICCMDAHSYEHFLASLVAVTGLIYPSDDVTSDGTPSDVTQVNLQISEAYHTIKELKIDKSHPSFSSSQIVPEEQDVDVFSMASESLLMMFQLQQKSCQDQICQVEYRFWQANEVEQAAARNDTQTTKVGNSSGVARDDPIAVDSDIEVVPKGTTTHSIRVFDVQADANTDSLMEALGTCIGLPTDEPEDSFIRRSTRKRKTRYPVGVILEEESIRVNFGNNLAALRLLLLEQCTKGTMFELDHSVKLVLLSGTSGNDTDFPTHISERLKLVDLSFDLSSEKLRDLCEGELGEKIEHVICPSDTIMLIRQSTEDGSAGSIPKDALMDHFIGLSNTATEAGTGSSKRSERVRTEKGFTGTFLSSAPPPPVSEPKDDVEMEEKKVDVCSDEKRALTRITSKPTSTRVQDDESIESVESDDETIDMVDMSKKHSKGNGRNGTTRHITNRKRSGSSATVDSRTATGTGAARSVRRKEGTTVKLKLKTKTVAPTVIADSDEELDDALLQSPFAARAKPRDTKRFKLNQAKESVLSSLNDADDMDDADDIDDTALQDQRDELVATVALLLSSHPDLTDGHHDAWRLAAEMTVDQHPTIVSAEELTELAYSVYLEITTA